MCEHTNFFPTMGPYEAHPQSQEVVCTVPTPAGAGTADQDKTSTTCTLVHMASPHGAQGINLMPLRSTYNRRILTLEINAMQKKQKLHTK